MQAGVSIAGTSLPAAFRLPGKSFIVTGQFAAAVGTQHMGRAFALQFPAGLSCFFFAGCFLRNLHRRFQRDKAAAHFGVGRGQVILYGHGQMAVQVGGPLQQLADGLHGLCLAKGRVSVRHHGVGSEPPQFQVHFPCNR